MRITFLDHSGFLVELPSVTLLFDWWKGELPTLRQGIPLLVFSIAEIGPHTGYGEVLLAAIQRRNAVVLTGDKPPVLVQDGLAGELVMLKGEVLLRHAVVGIFRA